MLWLLKLGITMLIHNKDDIEFVTEFPCFWDTLYLFTGSKKFQVVFICSHKKNDYFSIWVFYIVAIREKGKKFKD